jgi:hypothetical protein
MTVRVRSLFAQLDNDQLATMITSALLTKTSDADKAQAPDKVGTAWRRWGDVHGKRVVVD